MKFLVVDDSKLSRKKIILFLQDLGHEVIGEAVDGYDAIAKTKQLSPTWITMDLEMPKLGGIDAIKEIVQINPMIKIILVTSVADKTEILSAIKHGANGFLKKPMTKEMLDAEIKKLNR